MADQPRSSTTECMGEHASAALFKEALAQSVSEACLPELGRSAAAGRVGATRQRKEQLL